MATTVTPTLIDDLTTLIPKKLVRARPLFDPELVGRALKDSFVKAESFHAAEEPRDFCGGSRRGAGWGFSGS